MKRLKQICTTVDNGADWLGSQFERFSIWRWHIMFMFIGLGLYLVVLPLLHLIVVSVGMETTVGNYTNIISAGVSLLTLAEAKRITENQTKNHAKQLDTINKNHASQLQAIHDNKRAGIK
jgi:hypothetical protein